MTPFRILLCNQGVRVMEQPVALSALAKKVQASEIRELLKLIDNPNIISLFPLNEIREGFQSALADNESASQALQYSITEGLIGLREWLCEHMARSGVTCSPDNILIVNGSQQALDLIGRLLLDPGDRVLAARPTYLGAIQALSTCSPQWQPLIPGEASQNARGAKLAYVVPDYGNPDGRTWTQAERLDLLKASDDNGFAIIEDAAYSELGFEPSPPSSILAESVRQCGDIDRSRVLYCGTFSKTIAPAFRIGWVCAAQSLIRKLVLLKQSSDLHASTINQFALMRILPNYRQSVDAARTLYATRRDAMMTSLDRTMPAGVSWTKPAGGLFTWLTLPDGFDARDLLTRALKSGVAFVPGAPFFAVDPLPNTLRLSYSLTPPNRIEEGVGRLVQTIAET
jgi:DNA-binding transcriptional MocR family regulator